MSLSPSLKGADESAALASVVSGFIQKQGGVRGVVSQFEKQGLGPTIQSWVGNGENHPISSGQIFRALGFATLQQLGGQLGMSPDEMAAKLSKALPKAIEKAAADAGRKQAPARSGWRYLMSFAI